MATASGPNLLLFQIPSFYSFWQMYTTFFNEHYISQSLFYLDIFLFSLENFPITLNCFLPLPFFFLLVEKMSLSSIFRLITSPLSIKLNDFYCLWDLQPHSFPPSHQFSSFLIPLASPSVPKHRQIFHMPCFDSFRTCLFLFSLLPSHFYQTIFSLYLFPQYIFPLFQLEPSQTAESIQLLEQRAFDIIIFT